MTRNQPDPAPEPDGIPEDPDQLSIGDVDPTLDPTPPPANPEPSAVEEVALVYSVETVKVGDTITIDHASNGLVRLPDGTVVTCRTSYTVRHPGEHVLFVTRDGETVETTVEVTK